ncbi:unnamed protein product [Symbiodinium sp. CCMP2592]|nr:unnamed protein product [Symbiodinium sp. CCMP2592]
MFQAGWSLCFLAQAVAAGQLHDQTAFKAAGVSAPRGPAPLSDVPDEELLADGERAENTTHLLKPKIPPEGLALLKEDLQWLRDIMFPAVGVPFFPWTLVSFCLSWLTVLASAGLARSLLSDRQLSPSKSVDDFQEPGESMDVQAEEPGEEAPGVPPPKRDPEVTNPVLLQRATEKEEQAQRRAVHIRKAQKDYGDVFGCSALHVAAHNGMVLTRPDATEPNLRDRNKVAPSSSLLSIRTLAESYPRDFDQLATSRQIWGIQGDGRAFLCISILLRPYHKLQKQEAVPSKLIGWESTSGMKNAGVAKFQELPPSAGTPACRVTVQMSLKTPSLLRRVFQSRRLSSMAESAIGKDLATFREVLLARKALASACAVVLERPKVNSTYKDNLGRCELLVWQDGRLEFELNGLGTSDNTRKMLEDCSTAIKEFGDSVQCTALIDMRRGIGCSPLAVPGIVNFLQKDGGRILHTAVLGPRPLMALAQMISRLAKQSGVAFFFDRQEAERWCAEPVQQVR